MNVRRGLSALLLTLLCAGFFAAGCGEDDGGKDATSSGLPNPASLHCGEQGGTLEIREDDEGNQYGVCKFQDGTECEEWTFREGKCAPGDCAEWESCQTLRPGPDSG